MTAGAHNTTSANAVSSDQHAVIALDIGFNLNYVPKAGNLSRDGLLVCAQPQCGFTHPRIEGNPLFIARQWKTGDVMWINLFDLTFPSDSKKSWVTSLSLCMSFDPATADSPPSPTNGQGMSPDADQASPAFLCFEIDVPEGEDGDDAHTGKSTVFNGTYPMWNALCPVQGTPDYPEDQLRRAGSERGSANLFQISNTGFFYYTVELRVGYQENEDGPTLFKTFVIDPEMVVEIVPPAKGEGLD